MSRYIVRDYTTGKNLGERVTEALVAASFAEGNHTGAVRARFDIPTISWDAAPESDRTGVVVYLEVTS